MINNQAKGIVMKTRELKEIAIYCKSQGISPTIKDLCSGHAAIYLSNYKH